MMSIHLPINTFLLKEIVYTIVYFNIMNTILRYILGFHKSKNNYRI